MSVRLDLRDRMCDLVAHLQALHVFAAGLHTRDHNAAAGLSAILDSMENMMDDAVNLAREATDDAEEGGEQ